MKIIPADLRVRNTLCVVIGSGELARAAVNELACARARVRVVAKRFPAGFPSPEDAERVEAAYGRKLLRGAALVVAASSKKTNDVVQRDAGRLRIRVLVPTAARRKERGARAGEPASGERLFRDQTLVAALGDEYTQLGRIIAAVRHRAVKSIRDPGKRSAFFEALVDDAFLDTIRRDGCSKALTAAEALLDRAISSGDA